MEIHFSFLRKNLKRECCFYERNSKKFFFDSKHKFNRNLMLNVVRTSIFKIKILETEPRIQYLTEFDIK